MYHIHNTLTRFNEKRSVRHAASCRMILVAEVSVASSYYAIVGVAYAWPISSVGLYCHISLLLVNLYACKVKYNVHIQKKLGGIVTSQKTRPMSS